MTTLSKRDRWLALAGLGMGVFMSTIDASIVNISLPTLTDAFDTTFGLIQWVVLAYTLVLTSFVLAIARLGDMFNKKRIYLAGMVLFTTASLLCGLSPTVGALIGFRALQGGGAVMMQALGMAMVTEFFPREERGRALGTIGAIVSVGIALGPPIGGILIGTAGWRSVFLVNVPIGFLAFAAVSRFVPPSPPVISNQRFDLLGAIILLITMTAYGLGMTLGQDIGFREQLPISLLIAASVGFIALIIVQARVNQPMIDLKLFRNPLFSINLLMTFLVFITMGGMFIMPFFLQLVKGYETTLVGILLMANPVAAGIIAPIAGSLSDKFGSRVISLAGLIFFIGAMLFMSTITPQTSWLGIVARLIPFGLGFGLFQSPNNSAIMGAAPRERTGVASGLTMLSRVLGNTTGLPLMGALFTSQVLIASGFLAGTDIMSAPPSAIVAGLTGTFRIAAIVLTLAVILAVAALVLSTKGSRAATALDTGLPGEGNTHAQR